MRSPLIIRADADSRMGTGHVMRCIALGQAWQDGGRRAEDRDQTSAIREKPSVVFICATIPDALADRVKSEGFGLIRIEADPGSAEDIRQTLEICLSSVLRPPTSVLCPPSSDLCPPFSDLWFVLDGYQFDLGYQRAVRKAGCKLLLIDDYNHQPEYECDILLNQNINASGLSYTINPGARLLLGTGYTMLRREFVNVDAMSSSCPDQSERGEDTASTVTATNATGINVLVTLGGADPDNMTLKVIEALQQIDLPGLHVTVIAGPANLHLASLQQAAALSTINCELINSARDMSGLMHWADLAVTAAGSTCWELCCLGVPFISLILAENQRGLAKELDAQGVALCLGENPSADEIACAVKTLAEDAERRSQCGTKGRELIDGFGVLRVLSAPAKDAGLDLFAERLVLRPAEAGDMELFLRWANDPDVRRNSYHPEAVLPADHRKWFENKLKSADSALFVLELDGAVAGQVRYDKAGYETAEIDFSIDRRFRGLGLGTRMIERSIAVAARQLGVRTLRALVIETNRPSCRVFENAGFERQGFETREGVRSVRFEKQWEANQ